MDVHGREPESIVSHRPIGHLLEDLLPAGLYRVWLDIESQFP